MIELLVLGVLGLVALVVIGSLGLVLGLLGALVVLPFKILGGVAHLIGFLFSLPFLLLALVLGGAGLAVAVVGGVVGLMAPLVPFVLLGAGVWWLLRRRSRRAPAAW